MVYYNRSEEDFLAVGDTQRSRVMFRDLEPAFEEREGLFYRALDFPGLAQAVQQCLDGDTPYADLSIDAYQAWVETGWKVPHRSVEAVERFATKAREEHFELDMAVEEYCPGQGADHAVEEAGDYLWVITAAASNAGAVVSDSIKHRLYKEAMGTRLYRGNEITYPDWYDKAGAIAIKRGSVTVGDIDDLFMSGNYVPQYSSAANIYEDEDVLCATAYLFELQGVNVFMKNACLNQLREGWSEESARRAGELGAIALLRVAAIAHQMGRTLEDVISTNIPKITKRINDGTVDKSDGEREE